MANFNTDILFWEEFPEFTTFRDKDKSRDKRGSSKIMWAIALAERHDSEWYNLPEKYNRLSIDFLKKDNHNWDNYEDLIVQYKEFQLTQAERSLSAWNEMMAKRDKYLKSRDYHFDEVQEEKDDDGVVTGERLVKGTAEQLDKAYSVTPKMYSEYQKIKKTLDEERSTFISAEGSSLTDQGQM